MIFVNSMSDLFHEKVSDGYIQQVFVCNGKGRPPHLPGPYQAVRADDALDENSEELS